MDSKELNKVLEIIKKAREAKGMSQTDVADKLSLGLRQYQNIEAGIFPKYKRQQIEDLERILCINIYASIYEEKAPRETLNETEHSYQQKRLNKKLNSQRRNSVPFYDAEAIGGITETEMSPIHAPSGTIDIGDLLHDSQAAIRIYGNSMLPNYPPGCVVGLHKVTENFIEPGEVYVVETGGKRMLKRLFYKDDDAESEHITLYSDNTMKFENGSRHGKLAYPPFNIHKSEIGNLFAVTGVIKRNTNSIIMHRNNKP